MIANMETNKGLGRVNLQHNRLDSLVIQPLLAVVG